MNDNNSMTLTVRRTKKQTSNRSVVQLTPSVADELGVENGDFIRLSRGGHDIACQVDIVSTVVDSNSVYTNNTIRNTIQVNVGDEVEAEKIEVQTADSITIMVEVSRGQVGEGQIVQTIKSRLEGFPVRKNLSFQMRASNSMSPLRNQGGAVIQAVITETKPDETEYVQLTRNTKVNVETGDIRKQQQEQTQQAGRSNIQAEIPDVTYSDIGGLEEELERVREMIELPLQHKELFQHLGVEPPQGVILHGPPGTGKTLIAKAVANEVGASFHSISGPEIMSKHYGESEEQLREIFEEASEESPSIVFIDELDSIAPSRDEATGEVEQRIVAQLLSLMDGLEEREDVVVIGATNRLDSIDNALRRGGRFDREIEIGVPDRDGRKEIFNIHTRGMPLGDDVDTEDLAERTYGFVGADIASVSKEAAMSAIRRIKPDIDFEEGEIPEEVLNNLVVNSEDFKKALHETEPSAMREVFVEVPDVEWNDVGGLTDTKKKLQENIEWPLKYEDLFQDVGLDSTTGVLLYGPPGTGKTLLAKAVANESDVNFISVKGPELLNKYVGESEKGVRDVFSKARENAPTVVFFDEIDAIATERGGNNLDSGVTERVVSQLLTELDGLENLEDVMVIATSNRPELIDNALLRPGRIDRQVHVPVPDFEARKEILQVHTRGKPIGDDVDLEEIAERTDGFVGADLEALCRTATMNATRSYLEETEEEDVSSGDVVITMEDFEEALTEVGPSVSEETRQQYKNIELETVEEEQETNKRDAFH